MGAQSVLTLADEAHGRVDDAFRRVAEAAGTEPLNGYLRRAGEGVNGLSRDLLTAYDCVVAELSRHLVGMEVAVCPTVVDTLPSGRRTVRAHVMRARQLEATIRAIERLLWGDAQAPSRRLDLLHRELLALMDAHRLEEAQMLRSLEAVLSEEERAALATRLELATRRAPTRAHPHASRRLGWTRVLYRLVGGWDRMLDTMDSRTYPRLGVRAPRPPGLWGSYLLGRPLPTEPAAKTAAEEPVEPGSAAAHPSHDP